MPVLWNPTNENFDTIFEGIPFTIHGVCDDHPKGQKIRVENARANHLMNVYEKRGLAKLEYGDETNGMEDKKGAVALEKNREFKEKQIIDYNTDNERRKQSGMAYIKPTPTVVKYAAELGIELITPYAVKTEESKRVASLEEDNRNLREQMSTMMDKMNTMMEAMMSGKKEVPPDPTKDDLNIKQMKNRFYKLGTDQFKNFLTENMTEVQAWPFEVHDMIRDKWRKMIPGEECPLDVKK